MFVAAHGRDAFWIRHPTLIIQFHPRPRSTHPKCSLGVRSKLHFAGHCLRMMIAQVPINLHRQRTAVLVPQPTRHRGDVHAGFDAPGGEEVPQVVMGDAGHAHGLRGFVHGTLTFTNSHNVCGRINSRRGGFEPFQKRAHFGNHGNGPDRTALGSGDRIPAHGDLAFRKIAVCPSNIRSFCLPEPSIRQKSHQIGAVPAAPRTRPFNLVNEFPELRLLRKL